MREIVVGTRGSALALAQTELVCAALRTLDPTLRLRVERITTAGDARAEVPLSVLGRGIFVGEIEAALRSRRIDFAVHSAKDLPSTLAPDLVLAAFPQRADARDVLVSRHGAMNELPIGARVGTSSPRRAAQLRAARADIDLLEMRGNVDTRLRKLEAGQYDAIVLAAAGLIRLGRTAAVTEWLSPEVMIPCVGQGALALEARADDGQLLRLLALLDHEPTRAMLTAERAFLAELGAGCLAAVAANARINGDRLTLHGMIGNVDGRVQTSRATGSVHDAAGVGSRLARALLRKGAAAFLSRSNGPLLNRRVAITRPTMQSRELIALLRARGAEAVAYPTIAIAPPSSLDAEALESELRQLASVHWIVFTSANTVRAVAIALAALELTIPLHVRLAAIGQATANELAESLREPDFISVGGTAESMARELPILRGSTVLLPHADLAKRTLVERLGRRGAAVRHIVAYRTLAGDGTLELEKALGRGAIDAIVFASPSSARFAARGLERARIIGSMPALVCIGPTTARAVEELGFRVDAIATAPGTGHVVEAVERALSCASVFTPVPSEG